MVVLELLRWRAPPIFILIVLLTRWNFQIPHTVDREFVEVFSGRGEVSRGFRDVGLVGTSIDLELDDRCFDLTKPAAFSLVINEITRCKPGSPVVLAPDCRSLSVMSRHTSGRTALHPYGHRGYSFVRVGNVLSSRVALMCLLASMCGLRWILEQPDASFLPNLPRYQWLWGVLKAYSGSMYMGIFGSGSPKRHRLFSNDEGWIQELINKAGYMSREDQQKCETKTSRQYIDSSGKKRCVGVKSALKESAHYPPAFGDFMADVATRRKSEPLPEAPPLRDDLPVDMTDLELFKRFCMPLGDLWEDEDILKELKLR